MSSSMFTYSGAPISRCPQTAEGFKGSPSRRHFTCKLVVELSLWSQRWNQTVRLFSKQRRYEKKFLLPQVSTASQETTHRGCIHHLYSVPNIQACISTKPQKSKPRKHTIMNQHVSVFSLLRVSAPLGHYQEDSSNQDQKKL